MPLSEHEQRVLEQIERSLYADDPKFAATVRGIDPRTRQRRGYARAVVGFVVGLALLPVGIAVGYIQITFAGFLIALLAIVYGVATWRRGVERPEQATTAVAAPTGGRTRLRTPHAVRANEPKRPMIQRFEDRWNRRREE